MKKDVQQVLMDLVNIPTYGGVDKNHPIVEYLEEAFSTCLEVMRLQDEQGNNHFLIGVNTRLGNVCNAFMFSGHIDTVPPSAQHQANAVLENGHVEGLGSADMKGFVASLIANIDNFKQIKRPIIISLTSDEETDFYGIETILAAMQERRVVPSAIIIGEPTSSQVALSHRGNSIFSSEVEGLSCHSSTPELGINAINLSMEAISKIEECIQKYRDDASICITKIEGGKACNIVPNLCKTTISVRTNSAKCLREISHDFKNIYSMIDKKAIKASIRNGFTIPAFENNGNKMFELFKDKQIINFTGASEAGFIQQVFSSANMAIFGPGNQNCIHKEGEKMNIEELINYSHSLPNLVEKYYSVQKENSYNYGSQS